jgi:hypothetical protein
MFAAGMSWLLMMMIATCTIIVWLTVVLTVVTVAVVTLGHSGTPT